MYIVNAVRFHFYFLNYTIISCFFYQQESLFIDLTFSERCLSMFLDFVAITIVFVIFKVSRFFMIIEIEIV